MSAFHQTTFSLAAAAVLGAAPAPEATAMIQCGTASWYDERGTQAADGGTVDAAAFAAAHRSLPFGTKVRVENLSNGRSTTVEIDDRGPFTQGRVIDVSRAAAEALAFIDGGLVRVRVSTLEPGDLKAGDLEAADPDAGGAAEKCR
jgi:rare lipoprotein A